MTRDYVANDSDAITNGLRRLRAERDAVLRCTCVASQNGEEAQTVGCPIHGVPQPENNALQSSYLVCRHQFRVCQRPVQCARYGSCVVTPSSPACYVAGGCTMTLVCPTLGHCYRASARTQAAQG